MTTLYDHQAFTFQNYGGISRYFFELIKSGRLKEKHSSILSLGFTNNEYLKAGELGDFTKFFDGYHFRGKVRAQMTLNEMVSRRTFKKSRFDVFHPTYYDTYFLRHLKGKPFTVTFLDMIHEKFAGKYPQLDRDKTITNKKRTLIEKAPKVIAISNATKLDLVQMFGAEEEKIEVIHLGSSFKSSASSRRIVQTPYLLYVGSRQAYKNFDFYLEAIHEILKMHDITLVCAGGGTFSSAEQALFAKLGMEKTVKYIDIRNDTVLANLYAFAEAFVFPSLYEGFGIPVLESFSCGCPCLLSNGGSLPEVGGEAAIYFDPLDSDEITNSLELILNDKGTRSRLIKSGKERSALFSWENTFEKTIAHYESIM